MRIALLFAVAAMSTAPALAQAPSHPFLDPLFSDNMVLQRDRSDAVWGWTTPGTQVSVTLSGKTSTAVAGDDGKWIAHLPSIHAGGPYTIDISGAQTAEIKNVLFGDVWICSGQSNMQFGVGNLSNAQQEIAGADHPMIRLYQLPDTTAAEPKDLIQASWAVCSPDSVAHGGWNGFSAVGYFFGRDLQQDIHVPIGLIETDWGGTPVEAWTSADALKTTSVYSNVDEIVSHEVDLSQKSDDDLAKTTDVYVDAHDSLSEQSPTPADPTYDVSSWKSMTLPVAWQNAGLPDYHGIMWYRRTFDLTADQTGKDLPLHLGPIDDRDCTWVNGTRVGGGINWAKPRDYVIPAAVAHAGTNVITIRVLDTGGYGGVDGKPEEMHIDVPGGQIPLNGPWQYDASTPLSDLGAVPDANQVALQNVPSMLFNGMVSPLIPYGIKGAIWYQGEANAGQADKYHELLSTMIGDWRNRWGEKDFPFFIVQLANFNDQIGWAFLREAQAQTVKTAPNTGLAVAIDLGADGKDIHPKDKQDVGRRLELIALNKVYRQKVEYSGPDYAGMSVESGGIRVKFTHADGLQMHGDTLQGFTIAGADKNFVPADARIDGDTVVVSSTQVTSPVAVRYAFVANPTCNLYNKAGLPAIPFRTDNW